MYLRLQCQYIIQLLASQCLLIRNKIIANVSKYMCMRKVYRWLFQPWKFILLLWYISILQRYIWSLHQYMCSILLYIFAQKQEETSTSTSSINIEFSLFYGTTQLAEPNTHWFLRLHHVLQKVSHEPNFVLHSEQTMISTNVSYIISYVSNITTCRSIFMLPYYMHNRHRHI